VFATPTSDVVSDVWAKAQALLQAVVASLCLIVVFCVAAQAADDAAENHSFFSYLPAPPSISLPNLDIVPFWTSDLKIARKAYRNGEYDRALTYFQKASDDGNATADWYLGHMYRLGQGVPVDNGVAYSYYSRAAETYDSEETDSKKLRIAVDCQLRIADYMRTGIASAGITANPDLAARTYLRLASNYGHPAAMFALGVMNINGEGVQKNPVQGLKWLMAAARKRHPLAQAYLGDLYEKGDILRPDETRALMWYILAAESATSVQDAAIRAALQQKFASASEEIKLEADARAKVFSDQFPVAAGTQE
jgi:uncharacterized protein